jgi:hypothetical protein
LCCVEGRKMGWYDDKRMEKEKTLSVKETETIARA